MKPDYIKIFTDIINLKFPEKKNICEKFEGKGHLNSLEVLKINNLIFGDSKLYKRDNLKFKAYDKETIQKILSYQENNNLTNSELAQHFKLSRNTVALWKKRKK